MMNESLRGLIVELRHCLQIVALEGNFTKVLDGITEIKHRPQRMEDFFVFVDGVRNSQKKS